MTPRRSTATKVSPRTPADASRPRRGIIAGVSDASWARLAAASVRREYATGETIFAAGAPARGLFVIVDGRVRVMRGGGGRPFVLHVEGAGATLGEAPMFESLAHDGALPEATYPATAVAAEPTTCLFVSRDAVRATVRDDPELALALLARLAARIRHFVDRMDDRARLPALGRLASLLLQRHEASRGRSFALAPTQRQAAEELGTVREIVVRGLRELCERGVIARAGGGRYLVRDEPALRALADARA